MTRPAPDPHPTPPEQPLVETYFDACSRGDAAAVAACFTADATVYDVNHRPVRGAENIGSFYARVREQWSGARWRVDTFVGQDEVAAIEWSMSGTFEGAPFTARGSEHYAFRDGRIDQIRQYWHFDPSSPATGLRDYPYAEDTRFEPEAGQA